jgi:hypothetical protein
VVMGAAGTWGQSHPTALRSNVHDSCCFSLQKCSSFCADRHFSVANAHPQPSPHLSVSATLKST